MRVFVAGATGAVGRPLVERLLEDGHHVVGSTRTEDGADRLRDAGAVPAVVDLTDLDLVESIIVAAKPDVVINQLTSLPAVMDDEALEQGIAETAHLRSVVAPAIAAAAAEAGAQRLIAQSTAFESASADDALARLEKSALQTPGLDGIVLRYGYFFGPGTWYPDRPDAGPDGDPDDPFVHVIDAAEAAAYAVVRGKPGTYVICDDVIKSADAEKELGWEPRSG